MRTFVGKMLAKIHTEESGAVMLLLLAAFLVLFMVAMTVYDAGFAARDKMDAQIAADASAFSHSVIKSRSMNMIVYANIIKRMMFSYAATYTNGILALLLTFLEHTALCARMCGPVPCPRLKSCYELGQNFFLWTSEFLEAPFDFYSLSLTPFMLDKGRPGPEIERLERYQQYMFKIAPWWAWAENITRGMNNGAMVTASWPPPAGNIIEDVKRFTLNVGGALDWVLGSNLLGMLPSFTTSVDVLPITRRDRQKDWTTEVGPFKVDFNLTKYLGLANVEYCAAWAGSFEFMVNTGQTFFDSDDDFEWFLPQFLLLQSLAVVALSPGCWIVNSIWAGLKGAHMDWKINTKNVGDGNDWLQMTSSLTYSYVPHAGRNDDAGERQKFTYLSREAQLSDLLYKNEGTFAMARSELTYKPARFTDYEFLPVIGDLPLLGNRLGIQSEPDMWSPRWTSKLRPVGLPGERLKKSTVQAGTAGQPSGFNTVVADTMPYLVMGGAIGGLLSGENFGLNSAMNDLFYLWRASRTMGPTETMGLGK